MRKISPCLWFDRQAEEAVELYLSVFDDSRVVHVERYGEAGPREEGSVMTIEFELAGQSYLALNGGPEFVFNEAMSLYVSCEDQEEIDRYWSKLTADGGQEGPCGWLKDRFGVSWQIVPRVLNELIADPDRAKSARVTRAMFGMGKLDIAGLQAAAAAG
ncbi:Glyoxalase superfamily enzyme, possibly 3-demethylubiquinone-9 3-methyltransferase [Streptomyces zhaozhouensis]|uniref:Glyoxalase superfamily enzyme, possibly 3-demethylubiquinone-9 3-methyltransferase n=1 Tax=Streptomyces zhaozhouensis TaxID=1300267 RepID=A0A286DX87_9ACTN|nr:VOC family protein [Streptomyces zhaozhouensis]SOD63285.1 Glyoxalase superfamily enzyme, possibly 3-demethylubiquinone-9 3-methyltransferase [Streptomyces zhaozhouensis]